MTRRDFTGSMTVGTGAALLAVRRAAAGPVSGTVLVAGPKASAYAETLEEIVGCIQRGGTETMVVDTLSDSGWAEFDKAATAGPKLLVAVGSEAVEWTTRGRWAVPVITSMTLRAPAKHANLVSSIVLGIPLPTVLAKLKACFADKSRLGILFNPAAGESRAQVKTECTRAGFSVEIADCQTAAELVSRFIALKEHRVDFALCFPDATLYNATTIKPLVLASLEQRIGLVGFSASFVRAGAVVGVYADLKAVGQQTAGAALRYLSTQRAAQQESPQSVQVGINQRVARLIGLEPPKNQTPDTVIFK